MATSRGGSTAFRRGETTVEGILVPRRWKAGGEVAAVALNALDEREYVIEDPRCASLGLLKHLRSRVRLTGTVIGNLMVHITSVSVLDSLDVPESPPGEGGEK
jgi:hypothetical protein